MASPIVGIIVAILAVASALPSDHVISKRDPGPRYQYMSGPDGPELVDTWMKISDVLAAARYSPDHHNGYHLFTRANPSVSQPLPLGHESLLRESNFDVNKKTVFLVHGWRNTPVSNFNVQLVHAYVAAEDVNLIMVDWSVGALTNYIPALINCIRSAAHVVSFINWLTSTSGVTLDNFHVIGHSLGGHQVGIIGRHLGGRLAYITALDPALPGWITNPASFKATDGVYTEVIHTDVGYSGLITPMGDVDFYPNGGRNMPGCSDRSCNHNRCVFYMAESLTQGGFTGTRCNSLMSALRGNCSSSHKLKMGGTTAKPGSSGLYYLETNAGSPFSQG